MPKIKIDKVLTFSSEDPHHPASNILNSDSGRKWKCAHIGEKTASVVLQLDKAMQITGIDIGNENSAYIEVLVSRSSSNEYKPLLGMSSFMTPLEARNHTNINKVRMFTSKDFSQPECSEKWDRIKFVCVQPYNKHVQYGLSFVMIQTNEGITGIKKNVGRFTLRPDSPTTFSVGNLFTKEKETMSLLESTSLKAAAAVREASLNPSTSPYKTLIAKRPSSSSPMPSTSKNDSDELTQDKNRNRNSLLYDDDDEAHHEKIDRLIEKKKREDAEKKHKETEDQKKVTKTPKTTNSSKRERDGNESSKKRRIDNNQSKLQSESPQSPKKRRMSDVLRDVNTSMTTPGPSSTSRRRKGSDVDDVNENISPRKQAKLETNKVDKVTKTNPTKVYEKLLEGVVFVISGIQNPDRSTIRTLALAMGAKYKADWDNTCTHLICAFPNTPKFNQVRGKGKIVKKQWIIDCEKYRKRFPWRRYCLDKRDKTGDESEEEIWEHVECTDSNGDEPASIQDDRIEDDDTDDEIERIQRKQQQLDDEQKKLKLKRESVKVKEEEEVSDWSDYGNKVSNMSIVKNKNNSCADRAKMKVEDLPILPNHFSGLKVYLNNNLGDKKKDLARYVIGYDGKLIDDLEDIDENVLAITYGDDADAIEDLRKHTDRLISPTWLLDCHNKKCLLPFDDFLL